MFLTVGGEAPLSIDPVASQCMVKIREELHEERRERGERGEERETRGERRGRDREGRDEREGDKRQLKISTAMLPAVSLVHLLQLQQSSRRHCVDFSRTHQTWLEQPRDLGRPANNDLTVIHVDGDTVTCRSNCTVYSVGISTYRVLHQAGRVGGCTVHVHVVVQLQYSITCKKPPRAKYPPKRRSRDNMDEVYVAFECTAKLYFRGPQRPVEHRCRLTLGSGRHQNLGPSSCSLTIEGNACLRRTFRVSVVNIMLFLYVCVDVYCYP